MISVNTENILFLCGGAFDGIDRHIANRLNTRPIGFVNKDEEQEQLDKGNLLQYVTAQDLKSYGLIPELIGRVPVLTHLDPLTEVALKKILKEPKNALLKQYDKLFEIEGVKLHVDEDALDYIVRKAADFKLGARGLRSIFEAIMTDAMFEIPSSKDVKDINLTKEYAQQKFEKSKFNKLIAA